MSARRLGIGRSAGPAHIQGGSYDAQVLLDSPVAYYKHAETSGTTMVDSSGYGRHGTYTGVTLGQTSLIADPQPAVAFSSTGYGQVTHATWQEFKASLTLECIFYCTAGASTPRELIVPTNNIRLRIGSGNKIEALMPASNMTNTGTTTIALSTVYHVAVTYDGNSVVIYVNGAAESTTARSGNISTLSTDLYLGRLSTGSEPFTGVVQKSALYNVPLSAARIAAHAQAMAA